MGSRYRQPPPDLITSQIELEDRVSTLETSPQAGSTAVDTGAWTFKSVDGQEVIRFGDEGNGIGVGWIFRRGVDGSIAHALGLDVGSGNQFFAFYDNSGNMIITDDASSGQGLARPYIPYTASRYVDITTSAVTTTSTTFVPAYLVVGLKQHPVVVSQWIVTTPAGVSMQVQMVDTTSGNPASQIVIAGPFTYGGGTFTFDTQSGPLGGNHLQGFNMDLQIRVSAGTGTVGITHVYTYGRQT